MVAAVQSRLASYNERLKRVAPFIISVRSITPAMLAPSYWEMFSALPQRPRPGLYWRFPILGCLLGRKPDYRANRSQFIDSVLACQFAYEGYTDNDCNASVGGWQDQE